LLTVINPFSLIGFLIYASIVGSCLKNFLILKASPKRISAGNAKTVNIASNIEKE
jgi:hypothetical protein